MSNFLYGIMLSGSLIMAIGAQNVFLIKNGIIKNNIFSIAAVCFLCDFILIVAGVFFVGSAMTVNPTLTLIISILSFLFLFFYGLSAFRSAWRGDYVLDFSTGAHRTSRRSSVLAALAITLLNPHVYLDTVVIIGGLATSLSLNEKIMFTLGALLASFSWFFGVGYGSQYLLRFFQSKRTWVIFDIFIGIFMWFLAVNIALFAYKEVMA